MGTNVATDRDYALWLLCHQFHDVMVRIREEELRRHVGISRMQAAVLFMVKAVKGPATPAEISRWLFREPHTVVIDAALGTGQSERSCFRRL